MQLLGELFSLYISEHQNEINCDRESNKPKEQGKQQSELQALRWRPGSHFVCILVVCGVQFAANDAEHGTQHARGARFRSAAVVESHYAESYVSHAGSKAAVHVIKRGARRRKTPILRKLTRKRIFRR